jgi:hypothetical protein
MTFEEILDQAIAMLQRRGRLTYGTLKRQFQLDDAALEDLKNELIEGQRLAVDERGNVLEAVWKQSLYKRRPYGICRARLRTNLLDKGLLAMLLETSNRLIYWTLVSGQPLSTVSVLIRRTRAVSRMPLALRLMSTIVCFTSGKHPRLR